MGVVLQTDLIRKVGSMSQAVITNNFLRRLATNIRFSIPISPINVEGLKLKKFAI